MLRVRKTYKFIKSSLIYAVLAACFTVFCAHAQSFNASSSCNKVSCNNSTCQLTLNSAGLLSEKCPEGKRFDVDPNCVMNNNVSEGSCMDTMPVQSIKRVSETNCYRANGAGGNPTPRNHLGTDYSAAEGTVVTAAADGTVFWAKPLTGGGNTIMIEHEKKCPCTSRNCENTYVTVYMHLRSFIVTGGSVKKGTPIGYVGGSNYTSQGELCQYGHGTSTCKPYGPHLHFEIHSGSSKQSYATLKQSVIDPLCDDIQSFCGGCSNNVKEDCTGKDNYGQWEDLSEKAAEEKKAADPKSVASSTDLTDAMPSYANTSCDYNNFLMDDSETCLFCDLFRILFNTASVLAQKTYNALKDGIAQVVIVAFALWIAWFIFKQISSFEVKKPAKMLQEILVQAFKVLLVILILKVSYGQILKLTIDPIFNTGMKYVRLITNSEECPASAAYLQNVRGYETELTPDSDGALPVSMGKNILCSIKSMQDSVWRIVAYGRECRCVGWRNKAFIPFILPNLAYVISGDLLIIAGLLLLLAFPWCLIDCVLNMAVAAALLPAAIGAWAFKITSSYIGKLFNFFLNAMFNFVFLTIILYIIMTVVDQFLQDVNSYATTYDKLIDPIVGIAFWSVNGLRLLMICLIGWVFLDKGKALAKEFASAPAMNIGQTTGGTIAQIGERMALGKKGKDGKRHGGVAGIAKGGAQLGGLATDRFIAQPIRKKVSGIRNSRIMNNTNTVTSTDANGNTVYELQKRNLLGQKVTQRVTMGSNGPSFSKDRQRILSNKTVSITKDNLVSMRQVKNAHGEIIGQDFEVNAKYADFLIDRRGNIDPVIMSRLQADTSLSPEQMNMFIASKVLADRNIHLDNKFVSRSTSFENGVLTVVQKNSDGTTSHLTTQMVNGQMLVNMENVDQKGNMTKITDNGVISRVISQRAGQKATTHYAFNKHIVENSSVQHLINYNNQFGKFASFIDKDAVMVGFDAEDITRFAHQERDKRNQIFDKDMAPQDRASKHNVYIEAYNSRQQCEQRLSASANTLKRAKEELAALQAAVTPENQVQMQARLNTATKRVAQEEENYNALRAEYNNFLNREQAAKADLNA